MKLARLPRGLPVLLLLPAAAAGGNEVTFPEPIPLSASGGPTGAAFNVVNRTWLVVWRDSTGSRGRIVSEDGALVSDVLSLTGPSIHSGPYVAHDPVRNEWMLVWLAPGNPEKGEPALGVKARKLGPDGLFLGSERLVGAATEFLPSVDVAVAHQYTHPAVPATPYFIVVWTALMGNPGEEEAVPMAQTLSHDPFEPSLIGLNGAAFPLAIGPEFTGVRTKGYPRITLEAPQLRGPAQSSVTNHRVTFEAYRRAGAPDVWLATIDLGRVLGITPVTQAQDSGPEGIGFRPQVAWNRTTGRTLVSFRDNFGNLRGRLFEDASTAPFLQPLADSLQIGPGMGLANLETHPGHSAFMLSANVSEPAGTTHQTGLACLSDLTLVGDPTSGFLNAELFSVISPHFDGRVLLAYTNTVTAAVDIVILARVPPLLPRFRRADADISGAVELTDAVKTLSWLFLGADEPACLDAADVNDDGIVELSDAVYALNWLFLGGRAPPSPGPFDCGADDSPDGLSACSSASC